MVYTLQILENGEYGILTMIQLRMILRDANWEYNLCVIAAESNNTNYGTVEGTVYFYRAHQLRLRLLLKQVIDLFAEGRRKRLYQMITIIYLTQRKADI
jgi:hypothetical protein